MNDAALVVSDLSCAAGPRPLFSGLQLSLQPGQWAMLTGPNGSGKTTLLRALAGLVRPLDGQLSWCGAQQDPRGADWHGQLLYMGHLPGFNDDLDLAANLGWQFGLDGIDTSLVLPALTRVGLASRRDLPFGRLSAGQRRRVSLARLSQSRRPLWLLDEPATALDLDGLRLLAGLLNEHLARGGMAVVASHQPVPGLPQAVALEMADFAPPAGA